MGSWAASCFKSFLDDFLPQDGDFPAMVVPEDLWSDLGKLRLSAKGKISSYKVIRYWDMWENVKVCSLRYCMKWHERIHAQLTEWTNESMNQRSKVWNELVSRSINNSKNQWFSEPMTEWIGEPMNQWINESMKMNLWVRFAARSRANAFCHSRLQTRIAGASHRPNRPTFAQRDNGNGSALLRTWWLLMIFFFKSTSRYNLVHFADLIFQKCSERHIFFNSFEGEIELLLQCGAHFADLIFQKCSERQSFFRTVLKSISSSRHSPVHFLTITSPDQDPKPQKPVSWPASELLHFPATWWWVVDMVMWLTWWCEC